MAEIEPDADADDDLDEHGPDGQADAARRLLADDVVDAAAVDERLAEVPAQHALPVVHELHDDRVVEPVARPRPLDHAGIDVALGAADEQRRRVAGEQEEQDEEERDGEEDRRDQQQDPADDVADHSHPP